MMRPCGEDLKIYLYRHPVDMRRGRSGLAGLAQEAMRLDPFGGGLFVYVGKRFNALKILLIGPQGPYTGKLLTDGLELYDWVSEDFGLVHLGCLQHCRTYYHKAMKVTELPSGKSLARVAIEDYIGKVYGVERQIKALREQCEDDGKVLSLDTVEKMRQEKSAPIMKAFKEWVDTLLPGVALNSALGKALSYTSKQWIKLTQFLTHPDAPADNNYLENQIRAFAVGRRAWLLAHTRMEPGCVFRSL